VQNGEKTTMQPQKQNCSPTDGSAKPNTLQTDSENPSQQKKATMMRLPE
jgi:hypothetical protein